ncbi:putative ankyrin repeat-containing protein [Tripterygium wilfordii]|uniref:Putative ankyrin repeat-containing protein n=1 Tax=Tripterygium wilfordii TaxID=458696 RepID=A0A7J7DXP0_TRIWF|nr:ankyrin repeat-containing protein ITN1-like [Tripterygium wilfordii]KAF5751148.1 putative ankyrin repeat-containing protein [Tripterygium wilfordii]
MAGTRRHYTEYLGLYKATLEGDWTEADRIHNSDPLAFTAHITCKFEVPLHIAAGTGRNLHFLKELVQRMSERELELGDSFGSTALHLASIAGNTEAARILVSKNSRLLILRNCIDDTPLHCAAEHGHEDTVRFLLPKTENLDPTVFAGEVGVNLVNHLFTADLYGIARYVLEMYPNLGLERDRNGKTALETLAERPHAFPSGSQLGYCRRLVYKSIYVDGGSVELSSGITDEENQTGCGTWCVDAKHISPIWKNFSCKFRRFGLIKHSYDSKLMHKHALEIVRQICDETAKLTGLTPESLLRNPLLKAARMGIHEIATMIIKAYPYSVWLCDDDNQNIFHLAVLHRQENVFNLLYQMSMQKSFATRSTDHYGNNILHLAGKLAPSKRILGAALQMQRELQWFKEVEKVIQPSFIENKNRTGKTPRMVFTEEHRELVKEGEKWMKDTASSYTFVAALVATVVFASAFTVPGGNNSDKGIPIFLNNLSFMVFAASDAIALFSSSTSVLMFLGILTSRYAEEDFLKSLPMRLSIGLVSLFISITSMLIAFSASMYIVLSHQSGFVLIPIVLLAVFPASLFAWLQFPLLVEIVLLTNGPSVFGQQSKEIIY